MSASRVGIRWTIGDVSDHGFLALRLSVLGAWRVFGPDARYRVCVNTVPESRARTALRDVPDAIEVVDVTDRAPTFLVDHFDERFAEGVAWKFAPLRVFEDRHEIALDNDCILWDLPPAIDAWLRDPDPDACLIAADLRPAFGRFAPICGEEPRNTGIRGLKPGYDLEGALRRTLALVGGPLTSELDEQGLQIAALRARHVVSTDDVTLCSPLWPLQPHLGRCGAHFVGLNARELPFHWYDRPASDCVREHFDGHHAAIEREVLRPLADGVPA